MEEIRNLVTRIAELEVRIFERKEYGNYGCWEPAEKLRDDLLTQLMTLVGRKYFNNENYSPVKSTSIKDIAELALKVGSEWVEKKLLYDHTVHYFRTGFIDAQLGKDISEYIRTLDKCNYFSISAYEYGYQAGLEAK